MAEVERVFATARDAAGGAFTLTCIVEDTQFTTDPRGRWSPTVVAVQVRNTSAQRGEGVWQAPNGQWNTRVVLPGENSESRIAPSRRQFLHEWAMTAEARWG